MTANLKKFLEEVSREKDLLEKVKSLGKEELIALAKELGIDLTDADFEAPEGELSEKELSGVSGGGDCYCFAGGGGTAEGEDEACGCVGLGLGVDTAENAYRCYCYIGGCGM